MSILNLLPDELFNEIYKIVFKECLLELEARKRKFRVNEEMKSIVGQYDDWEEAEAIPGEVWLLDDVKEWLGEDDFIPPYFCYQDWRLLTKGA